MKAWPADMCPVTEAAAEWQTALQSSAIDGGVGEQEPLWMLWTHTNTQRTAGSNTCIQGSSGLLCMAEQPGYTD